MFYDFENLNKMDYAEQIIQCYQQLSSATDQSSVEQATKFLIDFYNQHKAFPVLISILHSNNEEIIKQHAALGLKMTLKNRWKENIDKSEFLKPIFFLLMTTNSILVANHLIQLIAGLMEEITSQMVVSFANQTVNYDPNNNTIDPSFYYPMAIYSSLKLLDIFIESIEINENSMSLYQKIASDGFQINEPAIQVAAISYTFHLTCTLSNDLGLGPAFPQSLVLMQSLSGNPLIHELFDIFSKTMYHFCPIIDPHLLIRQILDLINNNEIHYKEREHAFRVLIDTLNKYKKEIFSLEDHSNENKQNTTIITKNINNYASYIFQATVTITQALFQENDAYDMSPHELIEDIAEIFSSFNYLLESFWEQIPNLQQFQFGHFLIIVFIRSSIDTGYEFYLPKLTEIASFLCSIASQSQSPCLREAAVLALGSFSKTFIEEITGLTSTIQETVFNALLNDLSPEMFAAFEKLIASIGDSDPIIIKSYELFANLINSDQVNQQTKEQIMWCISELIKNSKQNISTLFPSLFELFKSIIYIDNKDGNSQNSIKSVAIYGLAHLCNKCPTLFAPFAEDFAKFIVSNVSQAISQLSSEPQNENTSINIDESLITQCINAYFYIVENVQDAANSTIAQMIDILIQICQISDPRLTNEIQISSVTGNISIQNIALRVLCGCSSKYPAILQNIIQQLLTIINDNLSYHSAVGINWIASSITSLPNRAEVVPQLVNILLKMIDKSNDYQLTAKCFESLIILIEWCGTVVVDERVLQMTAKAFTYELFCFTSKKYNSLYEEVYQNAQNVFRQAINALQDTAFQTMHNSYINEYKNSTYIELFFKMAQSKRKSIRELGLQLLAELVGETPGEQIPNPFLENIMSIATQEANKGNYIGFFAIKKLACSSPFNINSAELFKSFIPMMIQRLFANMNLQNTSERNMITSDNCVSALGAIVMNILGDSFLESLNIFENNEISSQLVEGLNVPIIVVILNAMPPQIDSSENESVLSFYLWLFERANGSFIQQFAAVLIRLFTEPIETMRENMITDFTIQKLNEMLVQMVPSCGGQEFCSSVLGGDEEKLMILNSYLVPPQ